LRNRHAASHALKVVGSERAIRTWDHGPQAAPTAVDCMWRPLSAVARSSIVLGSGQNGRDG